MSESGQRTHEPAAELSIVDATMIGIGAMIGAGIFVLTGLVTELTGPAAIFVFILNGGVTAFTALSYAELASAVPKSGGGYAFVNEVFNDLLSFLMGWMLWFAYMIAGALYALGFAPNLVEFVLFYLPHFPHYTIVYAVLAVLSLVALNAISTSASGSTETLVTFVKVAILLVFILFGISEIAPGNFQPLIGDGVTPISILSAMGLSFIAFEGYDLITTVTEEVENPRKNIPRAIFLSLAVTIAIYVLVVFVALGTLGPDLLGKAGETGIARAAQDFMPNDIPLLKNGAAVIAFGAVFSTISALNAVIIASSRVAFAMGRDDLLPPKIGQLHYRFGTPFVAVLASATVMLVSVVAIPIRQVGNLSSLFFLLSFVLVNVAVIRLRRQRPNLVRPYEMPLYPAPPILGIALNLMLGVFIDPITWAIGLGWLAIGGLVYGLLNPAAVRETIARIPAVIERTRGLARTISRR